jgi:Fe-S-cluster containining protein
MQPLHQSKKPLPVPPAAEEIHKQIHERLAALETGGSRSCLEPAFKKTWREILHLIDRYQKEIAGASGMVISCAKGCAACCCHWVEDVNSFEAEMIAEHIKSTCSDKIPSIRAQCRRDEESLLKLNDIVETKLAAEHDRPSADAIDPVDLLLASFYRLRSQCPLLENGQCIAYPVRPLTCRMYVSFSKPEQCDPAYIDNEDIPTYLFDLEEAADGIIDRLHFRFLKFENDTGLRSLLAKYLRQ